MFGKLKHRFDEKGKRAVALLATITLLCGFTGCNRNEMDDSVLLTSSSNAQSVSMVESDVSREQNTSLIKPEIVMDGNIITLPCKTEDIEGITIDGEYSFVVVPSTENVDEYSTAYFYYNGKRAGLIRLDGDCSKETDLDKETVVGIYMMTSLSIALV